MRNQDQYDAVAYIIHKLGYPEVCPRSFNLVVWQILTTVVRHNYNYFSEEELQLMRDLITSIVEVEELEFGDQF